MKDLRLDYLLMRSHSPKFGDKMTCRECDFEIHKHNESCFQELTRMSGYYCIKSFAPRSNNGKQPVPDDFPVIVEWDDGVSENDVSSGIHWNDIKCANNIYSWKPDLEKLIEQQVEYDKQQEGIEYCKQFNEDSPIEELMLNTKESAMKKQGDEVVIIYNDLIGSGRKEAVGTYQMETDKEILILDENGIFEVIDKEWFVEYALTDEQEMKSEQAKQVDMMVSMYGISKVAAKRMQYNRHLSEIILPLRG